MSQSSKKVDRGWTARRLAVVSLGVAAVLATASGLLWWWVEGRMAAAFADWQRQMAARGWTVAAEATGRGGWPLAADLVFDGFRMAGGADIVPGGVAYQATRLTLRLELLHPGAARVLAEGPQRLRLSGLPPLPFAADRLSLTIPLPPDRAPTQAELNASALRFGPPAEGMTVGLLEAQADWSRAKATDLRVSAEAITLPPVWPAPLGPHIASATAEGSFAGAIPPDAPSDAAAARAWRDSGGAITLRRIALGWGPLGVSGAAAITLDADLQPEATATLRLVGLEETLTALAEAHVITAGAARAGRAVAGLILAAPQPGGAPGAVVPVSLRDGKLTLGIIPLANVPKLVWSEAPAAPIRTP